MNDESSSGGRGPSSIKPPTIKPPTARDNEFGATSFSSASAPVEVSAPLVCAMPQMQQHIPPPSAIAPPGRQQNLWLWIVAGVLLLGLLIIVIAVVVLWLLR